MKKVMMKLNIIACRKLEGYSLMSGYILRGLLCVKVKNTLVVPNE